MMIIISKASAFSLPDGFRHRTQVNRQVRRIRHQSSVTIEQRTGKIKSFLNVHRDAGALKRPDMNRLD
jgi:hypothetical protein